MYARVKSRFKGQHTIQPLCKGEEETPLKKDMKTLRIYHDPREGTVLSDIPDTAGLNGNYAPFGGWQKKTDAKIRLKKMRTDPIGSVA